jgi:hypothetical protein
MVVLSQRGKMARGGRKGARVAYSCEYASMQEKRERGRGRRPGWPGWARVCRERGEEWAGMAHAEERREGEAGPRGKKGEGAAQKEKRFDNFQKRWFKFEIQKGFLKRHNRSKNTHKNQTSTTALNKIVLWGLNFKSFWIWVKFMWKKPATSKLNQILVVNSNVQIFSELWKNSNFWVLQMVWEKNIPYLELQRVGGEILQEMTFAQLKLRIGGASNQMLIRC